MRNIVYVATTNNVLYALDGDSNTGADKGVVWSRSFTDQINNINNVSIADILLVGFPVSKATLNGNIGILGTPVIDLSRHTIYLVAATFENSRFVQNLHAIDIATGNSRENSPVEISGSVQAGDNPNYTFAFDPRIQLQRAGLAIAGDKVLIAWAAHGDQGYYNGWVMAYDIVSLRQVGIFCTTCNYAGDLAQKDISREGGIWQLGRAPVIDRSGNVYIFTGNGVPLGNKDAITCHNGIWDQSPPKPCPCIANRVIPDKFFGSSLVKLSSKKQLAVIASFIPGNWYCLDAYDSDFGGSGPTLISGTNLIVGGGKEGVLYLISSNTDSLQFLQQFRIFTGTLTD